MPFIEERKVFVQLRDHAPAAAIDEFQRAIAVLISEYNTTIYENRPLVGGVIEKLVASLMRATGIDCEDIGGVSVGGDILVLDGQLVFSVKYSKGAYSSKTKNPTGGMVGVKLVNSQGGGTRKWRHATLFVIGGRGIIYGDPDLVSPRFVKNVGDGLTIQTEGLKELVNCQAFGCVMAFDVHQMKAGDRLGERVPSTDVLREVLREIESQHLLPLEHPA